MEKQINVAIIADKRLLLEKFGVLLGKRIFKVAKANTQLDYFEQKAKIEECNGITTSRPIVRYMVVPVDITSIQIEKDVDGSYEVVLNKGLTTADDVSIEVHCPLDNPVLTRKVSTDVLAAALNDSTKKNTYFSSAEGVSMEINRLNEKEAGRVAALKASIEKQLEIINRTMSANNDLVADYRRQLSHGDNDSKDIHISIEA